MTRYLDLEVTPATVLIYGKWHEPVVLEEIEREMVICASWCDDGGRVKFKGVWEMPSYKGKWSNKAQKEFALFLRDLIDEPDILCYHNGDQYDRKKIDEECLVYGIEPAKEGRTYDTLKLARKYGHNPTNKAAYLFPKHTSGGKFGHEGYKTYVRARAGDKKAQRVLKKYNETDVKQGWELFEKYLPFIKRKQSIWEAPTTCPECGGVSKRRGVAISRKGTFQRYQCKEEGHWFQGKQVITRV